MLQRLAALAFAAALFAGPALAEPPRLVAEALAQQSATTRLVLHSDRLGRDFQVIVTLPGATPFLPGQKLPAVYALDGGYDVAAGQSRFLSNRGVMSPAAVVSIDYLPGEGRQRLVDLAHKSWKPLEPQLPVTGGGGAAFEAFLTQDLKPWLEAKYPIDPARSVLFGHSLGGVFAANVFADHPDAFAGYILASVAVWVQPDITTRVAATAKRVQGKRVFLSVAEFDDGPNTTRMRSGFDAMAAALQGRTGVALRTQVYPGENHVSYYARLVLDSFPHVLPGVWDRTASQMPLPADVLARYAGDYRLPDGTAIAVRATPDGRLTAQVAGGDVVPLYQNGPGRFYAPTSDLDVRFDARGADLAGGGARLRIERAGG